MIKALPSIYVSASIGKPNPTSASVTIKTPLAAWAYIYGAIDEIILGLAVGIVVCALTITSEGCYVDFRSLVTKKTVLII